MPKYYLDTSIWIDYYEKRGKNGKRALKLILKIIKENSIILYSDLHIKELRGLNYDIEQINQIFKIVKPDNLKRVHMSKEQNSEAVELSSRRNIPKGDALHAVLARDNNAIMITRDKDFNQLRHVAEIRKPEELY